MDEKTKEYYEKKFRDSEAVGIILDNILKISQQEKIIAKLTEALESIANHHHDFNEDIYRLCNYYEGLANKALQYIKDKK